MFNSTHTFVGLLVARSGADKWVRCATATAVIASNLPDLDSLAGFWGTAAYLDHHRGLSHTLIGIPILALLLSGIMYFFSENFGKTYVVALLAMATHPILDFLNSYGVRPLLPWNNTWYFGDSVFIFDPYLDALLLIGIAWGTLQPNRRRIAALVSFCAMAAYVGVRVQLHDMAEANLKEALGPDHTYRKVALLPLMLNPLKWDAIVETENGIMRIPAYSLRPAFLSLEETPEMHQNTKSPIAMKAASAPSAAALLRFARFPVSRVEQLPSGYRAIFLDFRFYNQDAQTALASEVLLDDSANVINESLSFTRRID